MSATRQRPTDPRRGDPPRCQRRVPLPMHERVSDSDPTIPDPVVCPSPVPGAGARSGPDMPQCSSVGRAPLQTMKPERPRLSTVEGCLFSGAVEWVSSLSLRDDGDLIMPADQDQEIRRWMYKAPRLTLCCSILFCLLRGSTYHSVWRCTSQAGEKVTLPKSFLPTYSTA